MSPTARAVLALVVVIVGLQIYGRWSGQSFQLDLLNPNQLGSGMRDAQAKIRDQAWAGK